MLCDSLDGRGVLGRVGMCVCMSESLHCSPETITVFLPGESHGQRSLAGYSPWGSKESDITEHARTSQHCSSAILQYKIKSLK